jgi:TrpR-related protein YerC/YecD
MRSLQISRKSECNNCCAQNASTSSDDSINDVDLFEALSLLESADEAKRFIADLCTPSEIFAFIERWRVCRLLHCRKYSYREIREIAGASLTTVGRVARFLNNESNEGYKLILDKISKSIDKKQIRKKQ